MDISGFDSQAKKNLSFYGAFVKTMFGGAAAIAIVLILMAIYLL